MRFIKGNLNGLATRLNSQHDLVIQARLASDALALLEGHNYINLETFKKDGRGVVTPVWFMVDGHSVIVVTTSDTGKAKRTKNNAAVRIMPSGFSG